MILTQRNTFILLWNPAISSFTMEDLEDILDDYIFTDFNWSIWEHEKAKVGDRYYMVRVGEGNTGVVMSGYIVSEPYIGEDWSGRKRTVYYVDLTLDHAFHPDKTPIVTTEMLQQAIPDFQWEGGHSGRLLSAEQATKLDELYAGYLSKLDDSVYDENAAYRDIPSINAAISITNSNIYGTDLDGLPAIFHSLQVGMMGKTEKEQMVGFMHDVMEDSDNYEWIDFYNLNFSPDIIDALILLTHDKNTDYFDYVQQIIDSGNRLAINVKYYDLCNNLARGKAGGHTKQVEKHSRALDMLLKAYPDLQQ